MQTAVKKTHSNVTSEQATSILPKAVGKVIQPYKPKTSPTKEMSGGLLRLLDASSDCV